MPNRLFLRPLSPQVAEDEYLFDWALYDITGQQARTETTKGVDSIAQTLMQNGIDQVDVTVLWPAASAFASALSLPNTNARYIQQALPFAIEEQLAQDLDSVHLAVGEKMKPSSYPVIGVDRLSFAALFDLFQDHDLFNLKAIYLDASTLVLDKSDWVMSYSADGVLLKTAQGKMLGLNSENVLTFIDAMLPEPTAEGDEETDESVVAGQVTLKVYVEESVSERFALVEAQLRQYTQIELEVIPSEISEMSLLCESLVHSSKLPINLCQNEFKVVSASQNEWRRWRGVAAIIFIAFIAQLGIFAGKGYYYHQDAERLGSEALASYQKIVPGSNKLTVGKLARVIKGKLNRSGQETVSSATFLELLGEAGYLYQRSPDKKDLDFRSINFNAQRGELVIELNAQSFEQLDRLKQAIVDAGLNAKIGSSVQEKDYFRGRITVSG